MAEKEIKVAKGGSFLTEPTGSYRIFTPEDFTEEQKMFAKTASDFMEKDVFPILERIEHKEKDLLPQLLVNGVVTGALLAVPAIGFTAIYAVLRFPNFSVASHATIGAFAGYAANVWLGLPAARACQAGSI